MCDINSIAKPLEAQKSKALLLIYWIAEFVPRISPSTKLYTISKFDNFQFSVDLFRNNSTRWSSTLSPNVLFISFSFSLSSTHTFRFLHVQSMVSSLFRISFGQKFRINYSQLASSLLSSTHHVYILLEHYVCMLLLFFSGVLFCLVNGHKWHWDTRLAKCET